MSCLWKMLRIIWLYLILNTKFPFYGTTPLIGRDVRIASLREVPFIVSLSRNTSSPLNSGQEAINHLCGGALITTSHVLTAAHCLKNERLEDIVIKIGSIDLTKAAAHRIKWWITFSNWNDNQNPGQKYNNAVHDIAIIKLLDEVSSNFYLPTISFTPDEDLYDKAVSTGGWGLIGDNIKPRYLRIAKFFVLRPEKCEVFTAEKDLFLKEIIPKLYLCTSAEPSARLACGDSGSPLLMGENNIVGVNKGFCPYKENLPFSTYRNLHASVHAYAGFIKTVMNK